jgi:hypothetical protein
VTAPRPDAAELLRAAAAGRRESAARCGGPGPREAEVREEFLAEAATLEAAARVVDGDLGPLYNWLPSWRWTPETVTQLAAVSPQAQEGAAPEPLGPSVTPGIGRHLARTMLRLLAAEAAAAVLTAAVLATAGHPVGTAVALAIAGGLSLLAGISAWIVRHSPEEDR